MKTTTNIYIITDASLPMGRHTNRLQANIAKTARALSFLEQKTELFVIGYNDSPHSLDPYQRVKMKGNPNLGEGLKYLKSVMRYVQKHNGAKTRSIFLLHSSGKVLYGWDNPLKDLFQMREFAFGLRYVVTYDMPDKEAERVFNAFTDSPDRILPYFSESRLCSLVRQFQALENKPAFRYNKGINPWRKES